MSFTDEENVLIKACTKMYEKENDVTLKKNKENLIMVVRAGHDLFEIISTPETHKLHDSILIKCDEYVETIKDKVIREEKESIESEKERKRQLKEKLEAISKLELERQMKELGLVEEEPKKEEPPRADVTETVMFNNFKQVYEERKETEKFEAELEEKKVLEGIDTEKLDNNTVVSLKKLAEFLEIPIEGNILKAKLIETIRNKLDAGE